jgi:hypothetical protein
MRALHATADIEAILVRAVTPPATTKLRDDWNWHSPPPARRMTRIVHEPALETP